MIYNNVKRIAQERKITIMKLENECGFSQGSVCKWNDISPSVSKVVTVANYLKVPIEKLLEEGVG